MISILGFCLTLLIWVSFSPLALGGEASWEGLRSKVITLWKDGRYAEATDTAKEALKEAEGLFGSDHRNVAKSLDDLGGMYKSQGNFADAELLLQRSPAIREKAGGTVHLDVALSLNNLAEVCRVQGKNADAEALYKRSWGYGRRSWGLVVLIWQSLNNLVSNVARPGVTDA